MEKLKINTVEDLQAELEELRHQLNEANETIEAIRTGQIDALIFEDDDGHELYTLKTADQSYRVFIEKMTEGAIILNKEGVILYCNSQFASMVGLSLSNVIGIPFVNFIADQGTGSDPRLRWTKDCKEEMLLKTDNSEIPVQLSVTALELGEGMKFSIILTDLSTLKKNQKQLEDKNRQLAEMNDALELSNHDLQQFASVASHDLQEPLRKIQMFSKFLIEKSGEILSPESKTYVGKIVESAKRMKTLILDVLNYSKLSASNNAFERVHLEELIKEILEDFELVIEEKAATVIVGQLPDIEANRGQIRQVFQNLLSNALKFSKKDIAPVIRITAHRLKEKTFDSTEQSDGAYIMISIKDNGIGFDEKYLAHVFTLFERLYSKDRYEGTGIGLAITKRIIEKHNGLVSAKSSPGTGAEFLLVLPIDQHK